jgi:hypothetical protein
VELALRVANVELDEGAGQLLRFPGRRRLAGAQVHDDVADPLRLAGLHRQRLGDSVPLVEQSERCHPLRHRSRPGRLGGDVLGNVDDPGLRARLPVVLRRTGGAAFVAPCQRRQRGRGDEGRPKRGSHPPSGVQAS